MDKPNRKFSVKLSFEEIKLPPFQDILILGAKCQQGKIGLSKSIELLIPNGFELVEISENCVEAVFINRRILKKMSKEKIIKILRNKVFQFVSEGEILKVDFKINISYSTIEEVDYENRTFYKE